MNPPKPLLSCVSRLLEWMRKKLRFSILKSTAKGRINTLSYSWRVESVIRINNAHIALQVKLEKTESFSSSQPSSTEETACPALDKGAARARDDPDNFDTTEAKK